MPKILVLEELPLEYLTVGKKYYATINGDSVHYARLQEDGTPHPYIGSYGRRRNYAEYIRKGQMLLLLPAEKT